MVYFYFEELLGRNCKEAYSYYLFIVDWLNNNLPVDVWAFDNSIVLCYNGVNIPRGFWINNFNDAYAFSRSCF